MHWLEIYFRVSVLKSNFLSIHMSLCYADTTLKLQNILMVDRAKLLVDTPSGHVLTHCNILNFLFS